MPRIIYSPHYNIGFFGLERLHPFDSHKYGRAWKRLCAQLGKRATDLLARPAGPARIKELNLVHSLDYLTALKDKLPGFLDSVGRSKPVRMAIYNAGTDVYEGDQLGGLHVSPAGVLKRDVFVVDQLQQRGIPTVMLLSGGYSRMSFQLVADSVRQLILDHS